MTLQSQPPHSQPPHSGYHWRSQSTRFFEGWYFRLTLPERGQTFAFMYSIDDPAGGTAQSGGVAQILGPGETYYCRTFPNVKQFWAWPDQLGLGHWRNRSDSPAQYLSAEAFEREVKEGYQASYQHHQGKLLNPSGEVEAQWNYQIEPIAGWGAPQQKATAGWLSYLPVFEPGWQVLMAHGKATGWVEWRGQHYAFEQAPTYAEKNWGGAFPAKWFWLQCNAFESQPDLSVTAVGGVREVLVWREDVGLIGIHYQGQFYEFISTQTAFTWAVDPWGYWHLTARSDRYQVELTGLAHDPGAWVRVPTREGMKFLCRDTTHGELRLRLWGRDTPSEWPCHRPNQLIVDATSQLAGLEVGGGPWHERWERA